MARGYSTSRSEARSPEALELRKDLEKRDKRGQGTTNLKDALEKDPTLKATLGNPKFLEALGSNYQSLVSSAVEDMTIDEDTSSSGDITVDLGTQFITVGGKTYRVDFPEAIVEYELDDDSFSYEYGSIKGTGGGVSAASDGMTSFEEIMDDAKIRYATPAEIKSLQTDEPSQYSSIEMPEQSGISYGVPYNQTRHWRQTDYHVTHSDNQKLHNSTVKDIRSGPKPDRDDPKYAGADGKWQYGNDESNWFERERRPYFNGKSYHSKKEDAQKQIDEYAERRKYWEETKKKYG